MARDPKNDSGHQSGTFLVRFWIEPAANEHEPAMRGTVKNLKTGEEKFLADPSGIGDIVLRHLEEDPRAVTGATVESDPLAEPRPL